ISSVAESFHAQHEINYGYARRSEPVEFVNLRLVALGKLPEMQPAKTISRGKNALEPIDYREVFFEGTSSLKTTIYKREHLHKGQQILGPAIVEQLDSTIVIFPNYQAVTDSYGNLLITNQRE
ncbi:MAG TPA: 5-oxoprolinase, partial [Desulfobacteraceae bacterium]|nr:5-oxoprolinase [Desulfobacteraceae bacterium]